jgi:hypothetical protein
MPYYGNGQIPRSDYERGLGEQAHIALDYARSGMNPLSPFQSMTRAEAAAYVNSRLPEGDPGRIWMPSSDNAL